MSLRPCPACARHVLEEERVCPFCDNALPEPGPALEGKAGRLTRAAAFAGAALMLTACGGDRDRGPGVDSGPAADASSADAGGADAGTADAAVADAGDLVDTGMPDVGLAMPYGAPPSRDRVV